MFTVISPHFGSNEYLEECVSSVAKQTVTASNHLIVFDGPETESTHYNNTKTQCSLQQIGAASARNLAAFQCSTEWIIFLDSDDVLAPTFIQESQSFIKRHPEVEVFRGVGRTFGRPRREIRSSNFFFDTPNTLFAAANLIGGTSGLVIKRELMVKNLFDTKLRYFEDWELYVRLTLGKARIRYFAGAKFGYRINPSSVTSKSQTKQTIVQSNCRIFKEKYRGKLSPWTFFVLASALEFRSKKLVGDHRMIWPLLLHCCLFPLYPLLEVIRHVESRFID